MAIPTLHLPLEGALEGQDRNGLTAATAGGALRWVDGNRTERKYARPLLVASPDNTEDAQGPLEPLIAGTVGLGQGQYGQTWKIKKANTPRAMLKLSPSESRDRVGNVPSVMEATENLTLNPSAETNMTSIIPTGGSTSTRVDDAQAPFGSWCVKTVTQGTATHEGVYYVTSSSLGLTGDIRPFIGSVYVKGSGLLRVWLRISYSDATSTEGTGNVYTLTDAWQRLVTPVVQADPNKTITLVSLFIRTSGAQAVTMWTDAAQVEQNDHATPYVDGDMTEGTWTGTPHASSSTRARGANLVGAVRPVTGTRTLIERGTTNLFTNPSLEVDTAGWVANGSTLSRDATTAYVGTSSLKVDTTAVATAGFYSADVATAQGRKYTVSLYLRGSGTVQITASERDSGFVGVASAASADIVLTTSWVRHTFTYTMTAATAAYLRFYVGVSTATVTTFWADALQLEEKASATSYADGSLGSLYSWTGTAHASASVRRSSYSYTPPTKNGWFIEEGTTNYYSNPIAANVAHTNLAYSGIVTTRITDAGLAHPTAGPIETATRIRATATSDGFIGITSGASTSLPVAAGTTITVGMWIRTSPEYVGQNISLSLLEFGGATGGVYSPFASFVATGNWQYIENKITIAQADRESVYAYVNPPTKIVGSWIEYTAVQFEAKPYSTSLAVGSLGTGYSWVGTAHGSASIRAASTVRRASTGTIDSKEGSLALDIEITTKEYQEFIDVGNTVTADWLRLYKITNSSIIFSWSTGGTVHTLSLGIASVGWNRVYLAWDATNMYAVLGGASAVTRTKIASTNGGFGASQLNLGRYEVGATHYINSGVSNLSVFPRPLTDIERTYVFANPNASWSDLNELDGEIRLGQEETTNLIVNPSFETNTSNWTLQAVSGVTLSSTTIERSGDWSKAGNYSGKVTVTANPSSTINSHIIRMYGELVSVSSGEVYTFSFYNKATTAGVVVTPRILPYNGATLLASYAGVAEIPDPSRRVTLTYVVPSNVTSIRVCIDYNQQSPNLLLSTYVDSVQLEKKPYTTAYVDGDMADGVWTGVAHASTTTRPARADLASKKSALLRYKNNGTSTTALIKGSQSLGTDGYARFQGGSLLLSPAEGKTLDVESVAVYDEDMTSVEGSITGVVDTWSLSNTSRFVDVPVPAAFVEEGTTNLIRDPYFLNDTAYWTRAQLTSATDHVHTKDGVPSWRLQPTVDPPTGNTYALSEYINVSPNTPLTVRFYAKGSRPDTVIAAYFTVVDSANASITQIKLAEAPYYYSYVPLGDTWKEFVLTTPSLPANAAKFRIFFVFGTNQITDTFWITQPQAESKTYPTTFCPQFDAYGSLKAGYSWSGTPHASTSTRAATTLRTAYIPSAEKGAYAIRFIASANRPESSAYLFSSGATVTTFLSAGLYRIGGVTYVIPIIYINGSIVSQVGVSIPLTEGQEYTYVYEWEGDEYRVHLSNGESRTATLPANRSNPTSGVLLLGYYGLHSNTTFTGALTFDRPLTESERTKLFETEDWEWDTTYPSIGGILREGRVNPEPAATRESFGTPIVVLREHQG